MKNEYTQDELKTFYEYQMSSLEERKIKSLYFLGIRRKIKTPYRFLYIENVGYILISKGYLITSNGSEPTHYFASIYKTKKEARQKIPKKLNLK